MELAAWATTKGISIVIALLILAIGWGIISSVTKKLKKGKYGKKWILPSVISLQTSATSV